ncbi:MAG: aminotransferase class I/II-fold pyridoxal phosphate-dependent enzyme [Coriobacteriales bacterium]|jgi:threonine aldolase|nr:aminotransferase class I/II-fold pyridoxal phosphate-dependent enzyme [Coriobacteriales bacterium]
MINLLNDYNVSAPPQLLGALQASAGEKFVGYGLDEHCEAARALIRRLSACEQAEVHFLAGGTQTNLVALAAFLRPHEAVIAADSAHINGHEAGAIEATGHKILTFQSTDGKVRPSDVEPILAAHDTEHLVRPRLLFLSQSTELGTVYRRAELEELAALCRARGLLLYVDGARLGYAFASANNDVDMRDLARLADAFYLGGTKNGALFGEALIIANPALHDGFRSTMKQRGAMIAKGFLLGIQFETLLGHAKPSRGALQGAPQGAAVEQPGQPGQPGEAGEPGQPGQPGEAEPPGQPEPPGEAGEAHSILDTLYVALARQANEQAAHLCEGLVQLGYRLEREAPTNQIFPLVSVETAEALGAHVLFERWRPLPDGQLVIRFVTTWQTSDEEVKKTLALLEGLRPPAP